MKTGHDVCSFDSNTEQSIEFWPVKHSVLHLDEKYSSTNIMYAYTHVTVQEGAIASIGFSSRNGISAFIGDSYCFIEPSSFVQNKCQPYQLIFRKNLHN